MLLAKYATDSNILLFLLYNFSSLDILKIIYIYRYIYITLIG
jgi:hypothetical protein